MKEALDYLNNFVGSIVTGAIAENIWGTSFAPIITTYLGNGSMAAKSLKRNATPQFMQIYGTYVNTINADLDSAAGALTSLNQDVSNINKDNVQDKTSNFSNFLGDASSNLDSLRTAFKQKGSSADQTTNPTSQAEVGTAILPGRESCQDHSAGSGGNAQIHLQNGRQEVEEREGTQRVPSQRQKRQFRNPAGRLRREPHDLDHHNATMARSGRSSENNG